MPNKPKILVALSGGVDSAVSLLLLQQKGYEVEAAFMKNFSETVNIKGHCPWREDREEAYRVAAKLGVRIQTFDFEKQYQDKIVDYIFTTYQAGQTPNPDVLCNNEIKFKLFLDQALDLGFDKIATGHYARIRQDKDGYHLLRGLDPNKDQSYFLAGLNQKQLARAIFPIGDLPKTTVRKIAQEADLPNAKRPDSQGICFIGKVDLKTFLSQKIKPQTGDIIDTQGNKLGQHPGVWYFTIGQRKGLNLSNGPWYVAKKDIKNNKLIVAKDEADELYTTEIGITNLHWLVAPQKLPLETTAQIRYRQTAQTITLYPDKVLFTTGQKGVASGQVLAIYDQDELIASANIA